MSLDSAYSTNGNRGALVDWRSSNDGAVISNLYIVPELFCPMFESDTSKTTGLKLPAA